MADRPGRPSAPCDPFSAGAVAAGYDLVVASYVEAFSDDLAQLTLDTEVLDAALAAAPTGWVVEAGCGPGPASGHYGDGSPPHVGLDISAGMLASARLRQPWLRPVLGDLRALPLRSGSVALVTAWYCLQHVHRSQLPTVFAEIARVLSPKGVLALATHLGDGEVVMDDFLGQPLDEAVGGTFHAYEEMRDLCQRAGFTPELERTRRGLPHEHDSERLYLACRSAA